MAELINISAYTSEISLTEFYSSIQPLGLYILGMVIYAVFVFKFYRFVASKDIFKIGLRDYIEEGGFFSKLLGLFLYAFEHIIIFPVFSFFWFSIMSLLFIFISKSQDLNYILLISIVLVAVIRTTAYYNEDLSKDLAKMVPFAILGIFLIDSSYFSFSASIETLKSLPSMWKIILYYLLSLIALEFVLRTAHFMIKLATRKEETAEEEDI